MKTIFGSGSAMSPKAHVNPGIPGRESKEVEFEEAQSEHT